MAIYLSFFLTDGGKLWVLQKMEICDEIGNYELSQSEWPLTEKFCPLANH